jgi:hypothetical protein
MSERCGYALTDADGEQYPCDEPATGWRWYQNVGEHEDMLDEACNHHANEGGRRIVEAEAALADLRAKVEALAEGWDGGEDAGIEHVVACQDFGCKTCVVVACASDLRALDGGA